MNATKTFENFLPARSWAHKLGLDWGYLPASSWAEVEKVDLDDGISASPSFSHVVNSERWDNSQLRSWVSVTVETNPEGLRRVSAVVEEWIWAGAPGPLDGLNRPDQRDMFWSAEETDHGIWRQSLGCPAGQPVAVMSQLMKMVEWLGVPAALSMVDTSGNAAARADQEREDRRTAEIRRKEEERLERFRKHAEFLLTPAGLAYKAQVDEDWRRRMAAIEEAGMRRWCQCSYTCTCAYGKR